MVNTFYTQNHYPTKALDFIMLKEAWRGRNPCIEHMRIFGHVAYTIVPDAQKNKFNAKCTKCSFLGYYEETKACRLICLQTK